MPPKGKGKGKGKKKKKAPKFDEPACSMFGLVAGQLLRTPLGQDVTVLGVKYGDPALKTEPVLWVEHKNGLQAPLPLVATMPARDQGCSLVTEFGHLACDVPSVALGELARTERNSARAVTAPSFLQVYHAKIEKVTSTSTVCSICREPFPNDEISRHSNACGRRADAQNRLRDAKPVVGVKIEGEEGKPRVEIVKVYPGGAFEAAGIPDGGYLTHVNGLEVTTNDQFKEIIGGHKPGDVIAVKLLSRDEATTKEVRVTVGGSGLTMAEVATFIRLSKGQFQPQDYEPLPDQAAQAAGQPAPGAGAQPQQQAKK